MLGLPTELRLNVYEQLYHGEGLGEIMHIVRLPTLHQNITALVRTCHQIRKEAIQLFHSTVHCGLFLTQPSGQKYLEDYVHEQLEAFGAAHETENLDLVQYLDLGMQDLSPFVSNTALLEQASASVRAPYLPPRPALQTMRDSPSWRGDYESGITTILDYGRLSELARRLEARLPNLRFITIHITPELRESFLGPVGLPFALMRRLHELYPMLEEIRVLRVERTEAKREPRVVMKRVEADGDMVPKWD